MKLSFFARFAWFAFGCTMLVFLLAPTVVTALYSVSDSRYFSFPVKSYSLTWYAKFFASATFRDATFNSCVLALVVTPLCLLLALPVAHALARFPMAGKKWIEALSLSPLIVPGVVTGVAFLTLFRLIHEDLGLVRMAIAMTVLTFPFALRALAANYHSMDPSLEEAARDLGCPPLKTYLMVTLPQLKAGLMAACTFVFAEVIDNFSVNVFLVDLHSNTLPIAAYQHIRDFDDPLVAVMATLLSFLSLALMLVLGKAVRFENFLSE